MPTPDPTNVLFKIAHPDLYARNPFNLLNLPIDATAKAIRRRREDIEAAFEAGTEAEEFRHVLPLDDQRKPPTQDAVHEAFAALNDPELRIAYSLFWFWSIRDEGDASSGHIKNANDEVTAANIEKWKKFAVEPDSKSGVVACHNLAVLAHLQALARDGASTGSDHFWREAIRNWNMIAASPANWHYIAELVTSLNDPRLDYRFARSLRDQFAFAFDQINVEQAIAFARDRRVVDAKLQVAYMKLSQPDADDVEGTFDYAFAGLQRQVEGIVNAAREEVGGNPNAGLVKVDEILERTKEPVQISRIVFDKGASIRESIITAIFSGVRSCMIAYGNETKDWDGCLKRILALKLLAENDRQSALVAEDERIITENKKAKDEEETCWFCKQHYSPTRIRQRRIVHLWGDMKKGEKYGQVIFAKRDVEVPLCSHCLQDGHYFSDYPAVKELLDAGWKIGDGPTQEEIRKMWGVDSGSNYTLRTSLYDDGIRINRGDDDAPPPFLFHDSRREGSGVSHLPKGCVAVLYLAAFPLIFYVIFKLAFLIAESP